MTLFVNVNNLRKTARRNFNVKERASANFKISFELTGKRSKSYMRISNGSHKKRNSFENNQMLSGKVRLVHRMIKCMRRLRSDKRKWRRGRPLCSRSNSAFVKKEEHIAFVRWLLAASKGDCFASDGGADRIAACKVRERAVEVTRDDCSAGEEIFATWFTRSPKIQIARRTHPRVGKKIPLFGGSRSLCVSYFHVGISRLGRAF